MQMAIRAHMKNQPHCMGSLFWQLNDCWTGPSWSIIDYYGKKKKANELVKTEFKK
jgi:beta-mannosidase